ncbi:MAG: fructose-1,6-bisphosphatase [Bacteroidetes bacterium]|nr:fructose-1,6-bisphosphatase [Bacteroidota bacterium]
MVDIKTYERVKADMKFLKLLSNNFCNIAKASTEIINLEAILNLPKGTEHFLTDIHGEYEAFNHVLRNASGVIKIKINEIFGQTITPKEKNELCTLIYYPEKKLDIVRREVEDINCWYKKTLFQLIEVCRIVSSKYTRSKVRKSLPKDFSYIIQEMLHESESSLNKYDYVNGILDSIISTRRAEDFISALSNVIQRLIIDRLHIVGDIYDRGPGAHIIMDTLEKYHSFDVQWGNHDILWMGAGSGSEACIANVIRISMRYCNLETLEDGYGINMLPLATFAMEFYGDDECKQFYPKIDNDNLCKEKTLKLIAKMHKAISIIQFKIEYEIIERRKEFDMDNRKLLDKIDFERGVVAIDGEDYVLNDKNFPTMNVEKPWELSIEEVELLEKLKFSFVNSEKLHRHIRRLYTNGSIYLVRNSNLLYHASIPLNSDASFKDVEILGEKYHGKKLLDKIDNLAHDAYFCDEKDDNKKYAVDFMWYLWCGKDSPLFDKSKMATFERYFIDEKRTHKEIKGHYYSLRSNEEVCCKIMDEFGITRSCRSHIINGHVPVRANLGEQPVRANGKMLVIDGGFSKAYQSETGIAGYTLTSNSYGLQLTQHEPFESTQKAIEEGCDIISTRRVLEFNDKRIRVRDTDKGLELIEQKEELEKLLIAYRMGLIKEKTI